MKLERENEPKKGLCSRIPVPCSLEVESTGKRKEAAGACFTRKLVDQPPTAATWTAYHCDGKARLPVLR